MSGFMTLQACCNDCEASREVFASDLFDFDCKCEACGGELVIKEEEGAEEDEALIEHEDKTLVDDEPTQEDDEDWLDGMEADTRPYDAISDRTKADTEDPYALAAQELDPTGSDRYRRAPQGTSPVDPDPDVEGDTQLRITARRSRVTEDCPEPESDVDLETKPESRVRAVTGMVGTAPDAPPLPSWDGGDTQQVRDLAVADPGLEPAVPLGEGEGAQALESLVEVVEVSGTAGRGSRTYDSDQLETALASDASSEEGLPAESVRLAEVPATDGGRRETLFPADLDWLALIDDQLTEGEGEDSGGGRVFIRMPEGMTPEEGQDLDDDQVRRLKEITESLETGEGGHSSLESLIMATLSESRVAKRYEGLEDEVPSKAGLGGQPTEAHTVLTSDSDDATVAQPRLDTQKWAAAFSEAKKELDDGLREEDGPTQAWTNAKPKSEGAADSSAESWKAAKKEAKKKGQSTRNWAADQDDPTPPSGSQRPPPSSRNNRRGSDGGRVINEFRHADLDPALVCALEVGAREADYFRQLYQQIFNSRNGDSPRSILVTSPRRREGKTTIAANLAIVAARVPGRGVVLVDADPRGGGVLRAFGERSQMEGLLEALETGGNPDKYVVQFSLGRLDVIPLGIVGSNAAELIASDMMGDFLRKVRQLYPDWVVIVDGSSVLHSADPLVLAKNVDGVVLVVRAGKTHEDEVNRVADLLDRKNILGVVLNDALRV